MASTMSVFFNMEPGTYDATTGRPVAQTAQTPHQARTRGAASRRGRAARRSIGWGSMMPTHRFPK
jgi:hypothetical protein